MAHAEQIDLLTYNTDKDLEDKEDLQNKGQNPDSIRRNTNAVEIRFLKVAKIRQPDSLDDAKRAKQRQTRVARRNHPGL